MPPTPAFARDTSPAARRILIEGWRAMPPERKAELVNALSLDCATLAIVGIRERYADASSREILLRLAALHYGRELVLEAFGWDARERGL